MTWIFTKSGAEFHLREPGMGVNRYDILDIAHALSLINRFAGHTSRPYSVAEHSLLVADIAADAGATPMVQLAALMHDAHEAYLGDVISPVKAMSAQADVLELVHADALRSRFALRSTFAAHRQTLRKFDLIALACERRDLTVWEEGRHRHWPCLLDIEPHQQFILNTAWRESRSWKDWRSDFLDRFAALRKQVDAYSMQ